MVKLWFVQVTQTFRSRFVKAFSPICVPFRLLLFVVGNYKKQPDVKQNRTSKEKLVLR